MSKELELARQWLVKARNDLLNADNNLAEVSKRYFSSLPVFINVPLHKERL